MAGTYQERRGYYFFLSHTWPQLSVAINESSPGARYFCNSLIFQASHLNSAIRHAVVAAGSLDERLQINEVLTCQNKDANQLHGFACSQYYKAIESFRQELDSESTELILMTCFIFICFEFLQGNDVGALTHLKSGLEILRRLYTEDLNPDRKQSNSNSISISLPRSSAEGFRLYATELFTILDRTACTWLAQHFVGTVSPMPESLEYGSRLFEGFSNVDEADNYLTRILNQIHCILPAGKLFREDATLPSPAPIPLQDLFSTSLNNWSCAMEVFVARFHHALSVEDTHRCTTLQISHTVGSLMVMASCAPNEDDFFRASDPSFTYIVSTAASLLRPVNVMLNREVFQRAGEIFSFHEGTIQPLYFTAIKCRNPTIRQNALELLSTSPWREGAWDSAAMTRIAQRKIRCDVEKQATEIGSFLPVF